jgi:erythromycin esterase-like protein
MRLQCLLLLCFSSNVIGQNIGAAAAGQSLSDALKVATFPIAVTASGKLSDAGGKLMADAIEHAQFVLLGESHFSRETPRLAAAVCRTMHPAFNYPQVAYRG